MLGVLGVYPRALYTLGKCCATELHPNPQYMNSRHMLVEPPRHVESVNAAGISEPHWELTTKETHIESVHFNAANQ